MSGHLDIWWCDLSQAFTEDDGLSLLTPDERRRYDRYLLPQKRRQFGRARAFLRCVLSDYLLLEPDAIRLTVDDNGKPQLDRQKLYFNLSHSGDWAVCAVSSIMPVGVDIEQLRPVHHLDDLAAKLFSSDDMARFRQLPEDERQRLFCDAWTRREAVFKLGLNSNGHGAQCIAPLFCPDGVVGYVAMSGLNITCC